MLNVVYVPAVVYAPLQKDFGILFISVQCMVS